MPKSGTGRVVIAATGLTIFSLAVLKTATQPHPVALADSQEWSFQGDKGGYVKRAVEIEFSAQFPKFAKEHGSIPVGTVRWTKDDSHGPHILALDFTIKIGDCPIKEVHVDEFQAQKEGGLTDESKFSHVAAVTAAQMLRACDN